MISYTSKIFVLARDSLSENAIEYALDIWNYFKQFNEIFSVKLLNCINLIIIREFFLIFFWIHIKNHITCEKISSWFWTIRLVKNYLSEVAIIWLNYNNNKFYFYKFLIYIFWDFVNYTRIYRKTLCLSPPNDQNFSKLRRGLRQRV